MPVRSVTFTDPDPSLDAFLQLPTPRAGAEPFMVHTARRMRATAKMLTGLFGAVGLLILGIALHSMRDAPEPGAVLAVTLGCFVAIVLMIGAPTWFYLRQDASVGRRLLEHGSVVQGKVVRVGTTPHGVTIVTVEWLRSGRRVESTFRLPSAPPDVATAVGSTVPLLQREGDDLLGLWQPGEGLVTTR